MATPQIAYPPLPAEQASSSSSGQKLAEKPVKTPKQRQRRAKVRPAPAKSNDISSDDIELNDSDNFAPNAYDSDSQGAPGDSGHEQAAKSDDEQEMMDEESQRQAFLGSARGTILLPRLPEKIRDLYHQIELINAFHELWYDYSNVDSQAVLSKYDEKIENITKEEGERDLQKYKLPIQHITGHFQMALEHVEVLMNFEDQEADEMFTDNTEESIRKAKKSLSELTMSFAALCMKKGVPFEKYVPPDVFPYLSQSFEKPEETVAFCKAFIFENESLRHDSKSVRVKQLQKDAEMLVSKIYENPEDGYLVKDLDKINSSFQEAEEVDHIIPADSLQEFAQKIQPYLTASDPIKIAQLVQEVCMYAAKMLAENQSIEPVLRLLPRKDLKTLKWIPNTKSISEEKGKGRETKPSSEEKGEAWSQSTQAATRRVGPPRPKTGVKSLDMANGVTPFGKVVQVRKAGREGNFRCILNRGTENYPLYITHPGSDFGKKQAEGWMEKYGNKQNGKSLESSDIEEYKDLVEVPGNPKSKRNPITFWLLLLKSGATEWFPASTVKPAVGPAAMARALTQIQNQNIETEKWLDECKTNGWYPETGEALSEEQKESMMWLTPTSEPNKKSSAGVEQEIAVTKKRGRPK